MTTQRVVVRRVSWIAVMCQAAFLGLCIVGWFVVPLAPAAEDFRVGLAMRLFASVLFGAASGLALIFAGLAIFGWFDATFPRISERRGKKA